jgi:L-fuconolactonase
MVTEADWNAWQPADLRPYIQRAIEYFGPQRCMYGSDWPVCELAGTYEQVFHAFEDCLGELSPDERAAIFGQTAQAFYGLQV